MVFTFYDWTVFPEVTGFHRHSVTIGGPGSSVGITTGYGLDGPGIESR
jgi:hypothetical protein